MPPGYGADGSNGDQPRYNTIAFNLCHELGVWEKQSSFYTQFKSGYNHVRGEAHMSIQSIQFFQPLICLVSSSLLQTPWGGAMFASDLLRCTLMNTPVA